MRIAGTAFPYISGMVLLLGLLIPGVPATADYKEGGVTKIGVITFLTGEYSDIGQATANAAELAVQDYNAAYPAENAQLILEDDSSDARKGLSAYQKLRSIDRAHIIIPVSTFTIGAVRSLVNREKRLTFVLGNEPYEPEDDFVFMLSPAAIPADRALGEHVAGEHPAGKIVVVTSENQAIARFGAAVKEGAGDRAEIVQLPAGTNDYRSIALSIKRKQPAALVLVSLPRDSARTIKALAEIQFLPGLYFDESIVNSISDVKAILGDLSVLAGAQLLKLTSSANKSFIDRYRKAFGRDPAMWADYCYDAVRLALLLKDKSAKESRAWLLANTYPGVSGSIGFDALGLRHPEFSIVPMKDFLHLN